MHLKKISYHTQKLNFSFLLVLEDVEYQTTPFPSSPDKNTDELEAKKLLEEYNSTAEVVWNAYTEASWKYNTDINEANKQAMVRSSD